MTPAVFDQLVETLRRQPLPLSRLHDFARDAGSRWLAEQLRLFLECMDGVTVAADADPLVGLGQRSVRDELADAILEIVRGRGGRPVPAQEVLRLLPERFTTSAEQIKDIAKQTPALELFGPGLLRLRK
jgi:hypothetical protein